VHILALDVYTQKLPINPPDHWATRQLNSFEKLLCVNGLQLSPALYSGPNNQCRLFMTFT